MIAKTEPAAESNSVTVGQFQPKIFKDSLDEQVVLVVGMSLYASE